MKLVAVALLAFCWQPFVARIPHVSLATDVDGGKSTFTITNTTSQDITAFWIDVNATLDSGEVRHSAKAQDYGPSVKPLRPGESVTMSDTLPPGVKRVVGTVAVLIFADRTAIATDDQAFQQMIRTRKRSAAALKLAGDTLVRDDGDIDRVKAEMADLLNRAKAKSIDAEHVYLETALKAAEEHPENMVQQAAKLHAEAAKFETYSHITLRLP